MAAANKKAGAQAPPLRPIEVQGVTVNVDDAKRGTYKTMKLCGILSNPDAQPFERAAAVFELVEYISDTTEEAIVELCGGDYADAGEVMSFALAVISGAVSKN